MKKANVKKTLLVALSYVLAIGLAIGGTIAYLTSTDEDVNVMVMGNVKIEQLEYERVVENGAWVSTNTTDKYGYTPDAVQEFTQAKPLMPAYFKDGDIKWDDRNGSQDASGATSHQQSWGEIGAPGSNQLFDDSVKNVQDKFVFVKNTGKSDAYVRTWIALEQGSVAADDFKNVIMTNTNNGHWAWETVATNVEIDGNFYVVKCATYLGPKSNPTGILAPGATSYASLLQVYMRPEATNEDVEAIDGNGNGTYDILVFSQATQTIGFESAEEALTEAFGTNHPWNGSVVIPTVVANDADLATALANGGSVLVQDGTYSLDAGTVIADGATIVAAGENAVLEIPAPKTQNTSAVALGDNVTIKGFKIVDDGVSSGKGDAGLVTVNGANVVIEGCDFDITGTNATALALGGNAVDVTVKDCDFVGGYKHIGPAPGNPKGIVIDGCTFDGAMSTYGIHLNATSHDVVIKNSTVALFNTFFGFGNDAGKLVFENCDFVVEVGKTNVVKLYRDADFINCDFEEGFLFSDANKDTKITFEGGSWGAGSIKDHFLADSFTYNMDATFDGDAWYWNTTTDTWEDR